MGLTSSSVAQPPQSSGLPPELQALLNNLARTGIDPNLLQPFVAKILAQQPTNLPLTRQPQFGPQSWTNFPTQSSLTQQISQFESQPSTNFPWQPLQQIPRFEPRPLQTFQSNLPWQQPSWEQFEPRLIQPLRRTPQYDPAQDFQVSWYPVNEPDYDPTPVFVPAVNPVPVVEPIQQTHPVVQQVDAQQQGAAEANPDVPENQQVNPTPVQQNGPAVDQDVQQGAAEANPVQQNGQGEFADAPPPPPVPEMNGPVDEQKERENVIDMLRRKKREQAGNPKPGPKPRQGTDLMSEMQKRLNARRVAMDGKGGGNEARVMPWSSFGANQGSVIPRRVANHKRKQSPQDLSLYMRDRPASSKRSKMEVSYTVPRTFLMNDTMFG